MQFIVPHRVAHALAVRVLVRVFNAVLTLTVSWSVAAVASGVADTLEVTAVGSRPTRHADAGVAIELAVRDAGDAVVISGSIAVTAACIA